MKIQVGPRTASLLCWTARLWSVPIIVWTGLLCLGPCCPWSLWLGIIPFLWSPFALIFAVGLIVAWRREVLGAGIAIASGLTCAAWVTFRLRHFPIDSSDLPAWTPAVLFLLSGIARESQAELGPDARPDTGGQPGGASRRFFSMPRTTLGWWSIGITALLFVFARLFWMQAGRPDRDRSTFFSDPVNALCLIGMMGSPIVGMALALVAIFWKRERSLLLAPVLLLGIVALIWSLACVFGNP